MKEFNLSFVDIVSVENLLEAWREFTRGKRSKLDVQEFSLNLMDNILNLHQDLTNLTYRHGGYQAFNISDPKPRNIHKAVVRDRLLHHAIYRIIYPFFDRKFIADSYSCRLKKGTHKAMNRFRDFGYKVSRNNTRTAWVLKCDIRKFFASVDQETLISILKRDIADEKIIWLLERVIKSFWSEPGLGLPLGNLTSQLLVNIYMNEFDQFVKRKLKAKYYIRYADDFVFIGDSRKELEELIEPISNFLWNKLKLELHPKKLFLKTLVSGVDFLGWVHFPDHRVLRTVAKRRMFSKLRKNPKAEAINSYLGLIRHGNANGLKREIADLANGSSPFS